MQTAAAANNIAQRMVRQGVCNRMALRSGTTMLLMPLRYAKKSRVELYKFGAGIA